MPVRSEIQMEEKSRPTLEPAMLKFINANQTTTADLLKRAKDPAKALMLLKTINALMWEEGCGATGAMRNTTLETVAYVLYTLHPELQAMITSICIGSTGPELARLRLLAPAEDRLYASCLEMASYFKVEFEYLSRVQVPGYLYDLDLFSRHDEDEDDFADLVNPADKIAVVNQMFYDFLNKIERYTEICDELFDLYANIDWDPEE